MEQRQLKHYCTTTNKDKQEILNMLTLMGCDDNDFNGENGIEYLWEDAKGFECNLDYCLSVASKEDAPQKIIETFISTWFNHDWYYQDYDLDVIEEGDKIFFSLAYITGY